MGENGLRIWIQRPKLSRKHLKKFNKHDKIFFVVVQCYT